MSEDFVEKFLDRRETLAWAKANRERVRSRMVAVDGSELPPIRPAAPAEQETPLVTGRGKKPWTDGQGPRMRVAPDGAVMTTPGYERLMRAKPVLEEANAQGMMLTDAVALLAKRGQVMGLGSAWTYVRRLCIPWKAVRIRRNKVDEVQLLARVRPLLAKGMSVAAISGKIGVSGVTIYRAIKNAKAAGR